MGFDVITTPNWAVQSLVVLALAVAASAIGQGLTGLARNYSVEFLAQRIERDTRDEPYVSLLGKSQTFHGRQRIGDVMARATNDVHTINMMFSPGVMLITDSVMAVIVPIFLIARISPTLLVVPVAFLIMLVITIADYNRRLKRQRRPARPVWGAQRRTGRSHLRHRGGQGQRAGALRTGQVPAQRASFATTTSNRVRFRHCTCRC